jgi:hypothetical protein
MSIPILRKEVPMKNTISIRNCTFAFQCTAKWQQLDETEDEDIRFCNDCQREVYYCFDDDDLARCVKLNRCVAFKRNCEDIDDHILLGDISPIITKS